jgi:DNA-binding MarR family transcriptional regulator
MDVAHQISRLLPRAVVELRVPTLVDPGRNDLTSAQLRALLALADAPRSGVRTGRLADRLGVTLPAVTTIADRLVEGGYLERVRDPTDRRVVLLRLSTQGAALIQDLRRRLEDRVRSALQAMDRVRQEAVVEALQQVMALVAQLRLIDPAQPVRGMDGAGG